MDLQPLLKGPRLELRPLSSADFEPLFTAAADPLIWEQHPQRDRYQRHVFAVYFQSGLESGGALTVTEWATGRVIGSSRYYHLEETHRRVKIGYTFLTRDFWGGSHNRELKRLMLAHAFQFVDLVLFEIGERNLRSRAAMEKIGGRIYGGSIESKPGLSVEAGHVVYGLRPGEFRA